VAQGRSKELKVLEFQERVQGFRLRSKASDRQTSLLDEEEEAQAEGEEKDQDEIDYSLR
jgi:hypothetical protein